MDYVVVRVYVHDSKIAFLAFAKADFDPKDPFVTFARFSSCGRLLATGTCSVRTPVRLHGRDTQYRVEKFVCTHVGTFDRKTLCEWYGYLDLAAHPNYNYVYPGFTFSFHFNQKIGARKAT